MVGTYFLNCSFYAFKYMQSYISYLLSVFYKDRFVQTLTYILK